VRCENRASSHFSRCQRSKIQTTISNMSIRARKSSNAVNAQALSRYSPHLSCGLGLENGVASVRKHGIDIQCLEAV
jgi:hypothetical protein